METMPVQPTYPGVYIEEIPSGVRPITGVATSITAFIGWAPKGPTDSAQLALSWPDYERKFGGLDPRSLLGYAVNHFFSNGGSRAYIIRLAAQDSASATATTGGLTATATGPGQWANSYTIEIKQRADDNTRFRLSIKGSDGAVVESFENLSMDVNDQRFVKSVIDESSSIINVTIGTPPTVPADGDTPLAGGADGTVLVPNDAAFEAALAGATSGVALLKPVDLFNLLCVPGETTPAVLSTLQQLCRERRAFLIADAASDATFGTLQQPTEPVGALTGADSINAAFYFPWIKAPDPQQQNRLRVFPPCGFVAGVYARTDATRGVWKAPAGTEASLTGVSGVAEKLDDPANGVLNVKAINCIRAFPVYGTIVWGARTLQGNDERGSEWKYVPVRRMALFLEESLYRGLKWVVFEPNDEPLWAQIRLNVGAFMQSLFRQGAFQGTTPREAYFVKCDRDTTTQDDINRGIVNIVVGFAPLKPAEFVVIKIQQMAGQTQA
jgi:phage tail sheath protein FI